MTKLLRAELQAVQGRPLQQKEDSGVMVLIVKDSSKTIQNECPDEMCIDARSLSRLNRVYTARV